MEKSTKEEIIKKWKDSGLLDSITDIDTEVEMFNPNLTLAVYPLPIAKRLFDNLPEGQDII